MRSQAAASGPVRRRRDAGQDTGNRTGYGRGARSSICQPVRSASCAQAGTNWPGRSQSAPSPHTPYEEDCEGGVTATYELIDDATMQVVNLCDRASGDEQGVVGEAQVVGGNFNTFDVEFGEDSSASGVNYVVAAVGEEEDGQYPWAAVYSPEGNTGWILAREPELSEEDTQEAEASLSEVGVDLSQLSDTDQPPQTYHPSTE